MWMMIIWILLKKRTRALTGNNGKVSCILFDGLGKYGEIIKQNVTGWKAVDLIYNHEFGKDKSIGGWLDDFWFNCLNCQAARNRFKLALHELKRAVLHLKQAPEIRIISLACGTGQIECNALNIWYLKNKMKLILIDNEEKALKKAKEYIIKHNAVDQIKLIKSNVNYGVKLIESFKPQIVTMIAFLDYLDNKSAINIFSEIYKFLPEGATFIVSNTLPNIEMQFVKHVVEWPLIYRKPEEVVSLIKKGGFENYWINTDPTKIQTVITAKKLFKT